MKQPHIKRALLAAGMVLSMVLFAHPSNAAQPPFTVIASKLDNPRGVAVFNNTVYVAEAGRGGAGPCIDGPEGKACYGATGAITRVRDGKQERTVTKLPSLAGADGASATGPHGVATLGFGTLYVTVGLGANPAERAKFGAVGKQFGQLWYVRDNGFKLPAADIAGYEAANNPDRGEVDSNPYGLVAFPNKRIVADAGGNDLVEAVGIGGKQITTLAVFPDRLVPAPPIPNLPPQIPMQSVPTSVAVGPNGSYFVGELTGFPFPVGGARVYKVVPGSTIPQVYADGFTNIIDVVYHNGNLYVLELAKKGLLQAQGPNGDLTGALVKVAPDGTKTTIASAGLIAPGGMAVAGDGTIYVSNKSIFAGQGELLRIKP